jgi:NAD(P)-dependent dehydrogenase (short-subunit alcohol dehydrogenase family)
MSEPETGRREITFIQEHVDLFSALSRDRNPLHLQPDHARRTPFARPVLFGVAGVLAALGEWANGRAFRLTSIRMLFDQPLFTGLGYTVEWSDRGGKVDLKIMKGTQPRVRISFRWEPLDHPEEATPASDPAFRPLLEARDRNRTEMPAAPMTLDSYPYAPDWTLARPFQERFGLRLAQWPRMQLSGLLFASYFIGMDWPGSQALFAELKFTFAPSAGTEAFKASNLVLDFRDSVSLLDVSGSCGDPSGFTMKAFLRPPPVVHSLAEVRAGVGASNAMGGQKVMITGASRGFGAVLAKAFALQGADVGLNYRSGHAQATAIQAELAACPGRTLLLPGDLTRPERCASVFATAGLGPLDLLVCNASPAIEAKPFLAQTAEECLGFVQQSLALLVVPLQTVLPTLHAGATVVYVSSAYVGAPQAHFSHYLAAKGAAEGLIRGLAEEFKQLRFILFRPPRMLTDQTNSPFDRDPGVSAISVAQTLLTALTVPDPAPGLQEIDFP